MLRLCPGDNLSQRDWLGSVLLRAGRISDALSFALAWLGPAADRGAHGGTDFAKPSYEPLSAEREKELSPWTKANLALTAALASFKLFGDCPASRQYLRIGAKLNPTVMIKILARRPPPGQRIFYKVSTDRTNNRVLWTGDLNMNPRQMNGPEDAHDYLWLTQDLWMEPDVWSWADGNEDIKTSIHRCCGRDGCSKTESKPGEFRRCASCMSISYCDPSCQKQDWRNHKPSKLDVFGIFLLL